MHYCSDKHLACGDGTNLVCCEVMTITVDYGLTIITLESHYFMLSCWHTPPDSLSMQYGRRDDSGGIDIFPGPYLFPEWASRHFGPKILVDFWCENIYHMGSLDLSIGQSWTYPWNLARGMPSTSLLEELAPGPDVGTTLDLASCPGQGQGSLFGLVPRVPQPPGTDKGCLEFFSKFSKFVSSCCS
jgi:hypothetical protein